MSGSKEEVGGKTDSQYEPDVHFEPVVKLAPIEVKTMEENEEEVFKMRAKLFRYDCEVDPPEWKERGTGEVKFLQHKESHNVRLLMRRDKTHKICANHYLTPDMSLMPSVGSNKAWVYTVNADFADEEPKVEQLAIRFKNAENANIFKTKFEACQKQSSLGSQQEDGEKLADDLAKQGEEDKLADDLEKLKVEEEGDQSKEATAQKEEDSAEDVGKVKDSETETNGADPVKVDS